MEVTVAWNHDLAQTLRLRVVDAGEGGLRIASSMPLVTGMTGIAIAFVPAGEALNRVVAVTWVGEPDESGDYHAGLRFLS